MFGVTFGLGDSDSEDLADPVTEGWFGDSGADGLFFRGGGSGAASPSVKIAGSSLHKL